MKRGLEIVGEKRYTYPKVNVSFLPGKEEKWQKEQ